MSETTTTTTQATTQTQSQGTNQTQKGQARSNTTNDRVAKEGQGGKDGNGGGIPVKEEKEVKKYKLPGVKIRGKEQDFEADEDQLKRYVEQAHGIHERYEEIKRKEKDTEQKLAEYHKWKEQEESNKKKITTNPIQAAIDAGASPQQVREVAEKWLLERIQEDEMSPDARRAKELEAEIKKRDEADAKKRKDEDDRALSQRAEEYRKQVVPEMLRAMDTVGVARTAANLNAVARRLKEANARKSPMSIEKAVQLTHEDNQSYVQSTLGGQAKTLNDAYKSNDLETVKKIGREIENFLGEETLAAFLRYGIVKHKSKTPSMPNQVFDTPKTKATPESVQSSWEDEREERKKRVAEKQKLWEQNRGAVV